MVLGYMWASGRAGYTLQIDYSWTGDFLEGAEVYVNGEVIGVLEPYGRSQRQTGFTLEPGEYKVRIVHPSCEHGREYDVKLGDGGPRLTVMIADIAEESRCRVVLR
jgi:hypothetical protein